MRNCRKAGDGNAGPTRREALIVKAKESAAMLTGVAIAATLVGCSGETGTLSAPEDLTFSYCIGVDGASRELVFGFPVDAADASDASYVLDRVELLDPVNVELRATYVQVPGVPLPSAQDVGDFDPAASGTSVLEGFEFGSEDSTVQVLADVEGTPRGSSAGFGGVRIYYQSPAGQSKHLDIPAEILFDASCMSDTSAAGNGSQGHLD